MSDESFARGDGRQNRDVVIVGGGLSGSAVAMHLLETGTPRAITIVERDERVGRGPAFGTRNPAHRLNVPAGRMSLYPDRPLDFVEWLAETGRPLPATGLAQRMLYGDYVETRLRRAAESSPATLHVECGEVVHAGPHGVTLADGRRVAGSIVALATGNAPPAAPRAISAQILKSGRVVSDPWRDGGLADVRDGDDVLLIGTGLTALDAMLTLGGRGHRGAIVAVSRRGLLPRPHLEPGDPRFRILTISFDELPRELLALARWLRAEVARRSTEDIGWQSVIEAVRPHLKALWQGFTVVDRARFLRLRTYWDVLRHRAPSDALATVAALPNLRVRAARIEAARLQPEGVSVTLGTESRVFQRIVLCTGPDPDIRRSTTPLWLSLLGEGHVVSDPLGLGPRSDEAGRAIDAAGPSSWLYLMGSLRRARVWEAVGAPDLVPQAVALARRLG